MSEMKVWHRVLATAGGLILTFFLTQNHIMKTVFTKHFNTGQHLMKASENCSDLSETRHNKIFSFRNFESHSKQNSLSEEVTIVTLYMQLKTFLKGGRDNYYSSETYYKRMDGFRYIINPVIAFFDNDTDRKYFEKMRQHLGRNRTKTFLIKRNDTWAFSLRENISQIFKKPGYPHHHPNTVIPEYSCAMHAKYEVMLFSTLSNFFCTRYFAWADIGYFRILPKGKKTSAKIFLPPNFNTTSVAYTQVHQRNINYTPKDIVYKNAVWVAGGFFIAEINVMTQWANEYMKHTEWMIRKYDLMSTDQQVLYAARNCGEITIDIQTYNTSGGWFHLGNLCLAEGEKRHLSKK